MMDIKKWYASKTIWGALIMIVATGLQLGGMITISAEEQSILTSNIVLVIESIAQLVGGLLAFYGRMKAKTAIG